MLHRLLLGGGYMFREDCQQFVLLARLPTVCFQQLEGLGTGSIAGSLAGPVLIICGHDMPVWRCQQRSCGLIVLRAVRPPPLSCRQQWLNAVHGSEAAAALATAAAEEAAAAAALSMRRVRQVEDLRCLDEEKGDKAGRAKVGRRGGRVLACGWTQEDSSPSAGRLAGSWAGLAGAPVRSLLRAVFWSRRGAAAVQS